MKRTILLPVFLLITFSALAQSSITSVDAFLDSLKHQLATSEALEDQINAATELSIRFVYTSPDSALAYGQLAWDLAEKGDYRFKQIRILGFMGEAYIYKANLPKTLELGLQAIELNGQIPPGRSGLGPVYYNLSELYFQIEDYQKSLDYADKMIQIGASQSLDKAAGAFGHFLKAQTYEKINKLDSALMHLEHSQSYFNLLTNDFFNSIYQVYPGWYNLRAKVYLKQNKPKAALADLFTTLKMTATNGEIFHTTNTYNDIAQYYRNFNQIDSSTYYATLGLGEARKIDYTQGILTASTMLAEGYEQSDPAAALFYYKLASEYRNKLYGAGNIQIIRDIISKEEKRQQDIQSAETNFNNQLKQNTLLGGLFSILLVAFILYRNNKKTKASNLMLANTLSDLKATQAQLIQSEKMASLGELTAGIAHEIQNPLNFVNNFSQVSEELLEEMKEELAEGNTEDVEEIVRLLSQNLEKIHHHGERASGIVKGMLQHSRTSKGEKEPTDINALCDEYLRLAYHGILAKDKNFNASMETSFDESIEKINVVPQDIGRVILNLITNAFQACNENGLVKVSTKKLENKILISVSDNGSGIPNDIKEKIFQPFFTTKPTGQGTGLGLSLAYDIVKTHGGELLVESKVGKGTTFKVILPAITGSFPTPPITGSFSTPP